MSSHDRNTQNQTGHTKKKKIVTFRLSGSNVEAVEFGVQEK